MADDFVSGALAGQQFQMNKFLIQEAPVKLEQEKLALKIGEADYQKRQQMADMLAGQKIPQGQNPLENASNALWAMGTAAAKVGLPEEAAKNFAQASTIQSQQEDAAYKKWEATFQQTKFADQLLSTVTDQKSLDQVNSYIEMTTGRPSALKGRQYSPELITALQNASVTKRQQAQIALDQARADRERGLVQADRELVNLRKTQEELNEARATNAKKVGGDGLIAKPKNVSAVTDYIVKDSGDSMSPADARVFARDIALDAERIMDKEHKTQAQAVTQAVANAKKHGVLAGVAPAHFRPGTTQKKPLPIPDNPSDPTQYRDQMWYQAADGPRWYDAESQMLYKAGEGPESDEPKEDEE